MNKFIKLESGYYEINASYPKKKNRFLMKYSRLSICLQLFFGSPFSANGIGRKC